MTPASSLRPAPARPAVLLFALLLAGCGNGGPEELVAEPDVLSFGAVLFGDEHERTITLRNDGRETVLVTRIEANCGCIRVDKSFQRLVRPGEERRVVVTLVTTGTKPGRLLGKRVDVHSNDPRAPKIDVPIEADIVRAFSVSPSQLYVGRDANPGQAARRTVVVRPGPAMTMEWVDHRVVPPGAVETEVRTASVGYDLEITVPPPERPVRANVVFRVRVGGREFEQRILTYTLVVTRT